MNIPNVSVMVDITNIAGVRLGVKEGSGAINFDVKARLEEKERKSQMVIVNFSLFLATKPSVVKFEIEGTATVTGKDEEINKMLEVDPEIKVPYVFEKVYQSAFSAMYLLSTILKVPPPPHNLFPPSKEEGVAREDVDVESRVGEAVTGGSVEERTEESSTAETVVESEVREEMKEKRVDERNQAMPSTESKFPQ